MKKEITILNNYTLPEIPTDPEKLAEYITIGVKARDTMKLLLKRQLTPKIYNVALEKAQYFAGELLKAELRLSYIIKNIKTKQGKRTDLEYKKIQHTVFKTNKSKKDIIKAFGMSEEQAKQISRLTEWAINEAIKEAKKKGKIPTRALAISLGKEKKRKANNKEYRPTGIYSETEINKVNHLIRLLNPIKCGSSFTNVGFDEYYLHKNGFFNLVANEYLEERAKWYREVYPHSTMIEGDINKKKDEFIELNKKLGIELGIFTPPCQTFTVAGKRDFSDERTVLFKTMLFDPI